MSLAQAQPFPRHRGYAPKSPESGIIHIFQEEIQQARPANVTFGFWTMGLRFLDFLEDNRPTLAGNQHKTFLLQMMAVGEHLKLQLMSEGGESAQVELLNENLENLTSRFVSEYGNPMPGRENRLLAALGY